MPSASASAPCAHFRTVLPSRICRLLYTLAALLAALAALSACGHAPQHRASGPMTGTPSAEQAAGAMIMCGFRGMEAPEDILDAVRGGRLGGVILFDVDSVTRGPRNIAGRTQLRALTASLQAASPSTLLIAVDEEGGSVQRLKPSKGFYSLPSHESLAARGPEAVRLAARQAGTELAECGINVDLAPVADVRRSAKSPGLGDKGRLYGSDPAAVSALDAAFSAGLREAGVIPALKHFPGLGSADLDSHKSLPDVTATWSEDELRPYADAFRSGWRGMVLVAHVLNARIDPDAPASLSGPAVTGLLRGRLGWRGVVISDDLQMGAVDGRTLDDVVEQSIAAGTDILLFGNNIRYEPGLHDRVFRIIMRLVREGRVPPERLRESWRRIQAMKQACLP